jgi:hypothetical protein
MSGDPTGFGDVLDSTCVTTDAQRRALGTMRVEYNATYGRRVWIWVKNGEASSAWAEGNSVKRKDSTTSYTGVLSTTAAPRTSVLGFAQWAVAAGSYSWILTHGFGSVKDSGSGLTANTGFTSAASGTVADGVIGTNDMIGYSAAAVSASAVGTAFVDCAGA